jgi:co-chaperonin GroES (HSP10)
MSLKDRKHIFESPSQVVEANPRNIRLLEDRCLIRDLGEPDKVGLIHVPQSAQGRAYDEYGSLRVGEIVAAGPGNRFIEVGFDQDFGVRRRQIRMRCPSRAYKADGEHKHFDIRSYDLKPCPICDGTGYVPITIPPECEPGDKVLYSERKEATFWIDGDRYVLVYEEQGILAILE